MAELETVTIEGVEILSAGGPIHGIGSPPEGDFYTTEDLEAIAAANRDLAAEVKAPSKIGHSDAQALAFNSELAPVTPGEMPAVGWLDGTTFRVEDDKLLADAVEVPKSFADLVKAKAYRTRSVELSKITSQTTGTVYDWVVTGLAWLGAKMPAVRTLDDVVALYGAAGVDLLRVISYAEGAVVWDPDQSFQALRDNVGEALNGPPTGGMNEPRFWVRDVDVVGNRALVEDWYNETGSEAWVIPFSRASDGTIKIAPSSDWTKAEQAWVETAKEYEDELASGFSKRRADTRAVPSFTEEQRKTFAEATGLEPDKVTDEMLGAAGVVAESDEPKPDDDDEPKPPEDETEAARSLEQALSTARSAEDRSKKLEEELRIEKRRTFVEAAMKEGKIAPGQRETLETLYDANQDAARKFVEEAPVNEDFVREYGSDEPPADEQEALNRAYEDDASTRLGIPKEQLV